MELEGKVIVVLNPKEGIAKSTGNSWKAQEYVIETVGQYPRKMCFEVFGADRIEQFANILQVGNNVRVSFDIDAREWNGRWFNSIRAFRVELADNAVAAAAAPGVQPMDAPGVFPPAPETAAGTATAAAPADDLPF